MFSRNKELINITVTTMDAELNWRIRDIEIKRGTTGKELFDQVANRLNLSETWLFGLQYTDTKGCANWIKINKKVMSHDVKKKQNSSSPVEVKLLVKFYPEDVSEITQDVTLRLLHMQVKDAILSGAVHCSQETSDLLSEYSEEASMAYLMIAQGLPMYGKTYFNITNREGTPLWMGAAAMGVNFYGSNDQETPTNVFTWDEIRNVSFMDKKFVIKFMDKNAKNFVVFTPGARLSKAILSLCMGNHEQYMRRRHHDAAST